DINENDYTIDADKIEALITEKTTAILPVHVYGNICDVEKIEKLANKYKIKVIYDAAHAFNETYKGINIAKFGDASMFSFHATKVFNTIEGGAVIYKDATIKKHIDNLKNFGIRSEEIVEAVGANAKMNEFQAAMGICNLRHLDNEIEKRQKIVTRYIQNLKNLKGLKLIRFNPEVTYNYSYFPVLFDASIFGHSRDTVFEALKEHNITARKYFYPLTNSFDCYKGKYRGETPVAENVSQNILTLPLYADLKIDDVDEICRLISSIK
ncbi:MAG: DegT/DnrJ/EryC1/StrS family aminotransferase, partial [Oscillospiraceae bacterium]